ncbi:MAG: glycoside hydrolase family 31 protein [Polyangiaceae bacterium]|nr:glycoside hydrolase family 31 protein [Polyangiaceae bacterium]
MGARSFPGRLVAVAVLGAAGCAAPTLPRPTAELAAGDYTLGVGLEPLALTLHRRGDPLLTFEADGFGLGVVEALDDGANYDPYRVWVPDALYAPPAGLAWLAPERASFAASEPGTVALALVYPDGEEATLTARATAEGSFELLFAPSGERTAFVALAAHADASEGFYGLGEQWDSVDQRGRVRAMQLAAGGGTESGTNDAHAPVPLLVGTRGWGLFVASRHPGAFDVATSDSTLVRAAFGTGLASRAGLRFHLFGAEHPLDVTRHYYDVTGYPRLPARSGLGPWVWRDEIADQAAVEADLDALRDLDLATTGYWIDRPYATEVNTFDFAAPAYPDPAAMLDKARGLGLLTALWHVPYLDESPGLATAPLVAEAESAGYYPPVTSLPLNKWGRPIDPTNPAAVAWWRQKLGAYTALGISGFKLDYGEDVVPGLTQARNTWVFADGSDERTMQSLFTLGYHDVYAPLLPTEGGFLLCRSGRWGDQANGPILWPGDLDATFARRGDPADDGGPYVSTGGLPASIIAGLSLGPSGFPFYGADTGGYRHAPPDKELFVRWFEQTALSTVMQVGTGSSDVAWEPTADNGFDAETLELYRRYARLHLRLWPYLWTHAERLRDDGRPIARALGLAYPELGVHPDDEYLLGDALLVAPVVERGATERTLHLPPGRWLDWWSGASHDGPGELTVPAPLGVLPLFLRAGEIVPMLRPTIDALEPVADPARVDSYASAPGLVYARAVARVPAHFVLFDGARLGLDVGGATTTLGFEAGSELVLGAVLELLAATAPQLVSAAGVALSAASDVGALEAAPGPGFFFDAAASTLWVKVAPGVPVEVSDS